MNLQMIIIFAYRYYRNHRGGSKPIAESLTQVSTLCPAGRTVFPPDLLHPRGPSQWRQSITRPLRMAVKVTARFPSLLASPLLHRPPPLLALSSPRPSLRPRSSILSAFLSSASPYCTCAPWNTSCRPAGGASSKCPQDLQELLAASASNFSPNPLQ